MPNATCQACEREMSPGSGCTSSKVSISFERIKYGNEPDDWTNGGQNCHDCNVRPGEYHHEGCDVERCLLCKGQLISCGHEYLVEPGEVGE